MNDPWNEGRNPPLSDPLSDPHQDPVSEWLNAVADAPLREAQSPSPGVPLNAAPDAAPVPGFFVSLWRNLGAGYRLAAGRAVTVDDVACSLGQIVALVVVMLLVQAGATLVTTETPVRFDAYGLNYLGASSLFSVLMLMLVSRLAGSDTARFTPVLVAYLGASVLISAVAQLAWAVQSYFSVLESTAWSLFIGLLFWQCLVVVRLLHGFVGAGQLRARFFGGVYILAIYASFWVFPQSALWYTEEPRDSIQVQRTPLDVETIFYAQNRLMRDSLAELEPQRPGVADLYLLAIGGFGLEDVFLKEVEFVRDQFDRQYATAGRSLILANNPATVDRYPLANRHNLAQGLGSVAQKMDPEEDVLFLFMTSHGSRDHRFSLEFGEVQLNDLTPQQLRSALDDAGIRWRVILVSSCFSGGFIEALQDPQTLVITAAAADRTSFGCGADSDFTYFGTAFFKQALMQQPKFIQAFDIANTWVSDKEQREKIGASQPQIFVGEAIAQKLDSLYTEPTMQAAFNRADVSAAQTCADDSAPAACNP